MKVLGISINYEEIEIKDEAEYRLAMGAGTVGEYLDTQLSDLRGGGTVIVDGEQVIDPYGHGDDDLLKLLAPVLAHVSIADLHVYLAKRGWASIASTGACACTVDMRVDFAGPTGRELPGEHWNARIIRETAESAHKPHYGVPCPVPTCTAMSQDLSAHMADYHIGDRVEDPCTFPPGCDTYHVCETHAAKRRAHSPDYGAPLPVESSGSQEDPSITAAWEGAKLPAPCHCSETGGSNCPRHGSDEWSIDYCTPPSAFPELATMALSICTCTIDVSKGVVLDAESGCPKGHRRGDRAETHE